MKAVRSFPSVGSAAALLLLASGLAAACGGGGGERPRRSAGSAIWVAPEAARLEPADARTLAAAGVEEVFLETGRVSWEGTVPKVAAEAEAFGAVPPGTPVTLVLSGAGPPAEGLDPEAAASSLAEDLRRLVARAEASRLLPLGVHLDLEPPLGAGLASYARLLAALRAAVGRETRVSATLDREWLGAPEAQDVARSVDFLAAGLYGQKPGAADRPEAWDPEAVASDVRRLEALDRDYLVEAMVLGSATHLSAAAEPRETTTRARLKPLVTAPGLRLAIGDPFAGVGRVVHTFQAQRASRAAGWQVAPGEEIRVVQTAPGVVQQILERIQEAASDHYLGLLFYRLAAPEEALSLAPGELAAVLGGTPPSPALAGRLVVKSRQSDRVILGFELRSSNRQSTDVALADGNFLRLRATDGYFDRVEPGGFSRYSLWRDGREARAGLGWREPDEVRLYTPMVEGGEVIGGGEVELRPRGENPAVYLSGTFYLPDGRELELERVGGPVSALGGGGDASGTAASE